MGKTNQLFQDQQDAKFDAWMHDVERVCFARTGLAPADFDDFNWSDAYEDGLSPTEAFEAMHEDQFGETYEQINGINGVGS